MIFSSGMGFVPAAAAGDSIFQLHEDHNNHLSSSCAPAPQDFHDVTTLMMMRRSMSFTDDHHHHQERRHHHVVNNDNDNDNDMMSDDGCPLGEKKRRLNMEQVKALEKSFELGNKLEPERKLQLATALGLQPRQVAIWFQNRRARWKTKQLEKDYDILKKQFQALKADNGALKSHNHKLTSQLSSLKNRESIGAGMKINLNKDNEGCWSNNESENSIDVNLGAGTVTTSSDSPPYHHQINKNGFPTSSSLTQLLQGSSTRLGLQCNKIDEGSFSNMLNGIEEQPNFWPWPEQQHFQ